MEKRDFMLFLVEVLKKNYNEAKFNILRIEFQAPYAIPLQAGI